MRCRANAACPGLSHRWRRAVLEVVPERPDVVYRRRRRLARHRAAAGLIRLTDIRLPRHREVSKFRQIFPIQIGGVPCEIAVWARDVRQLKEALANASRGVA
jgi:hypothetical protein